MTLKSRFGVTIQNLGYGFLFAFNSNYCSLLYHFQDKARYWSQVVIFSYPLAFVLIGILPHCFGVEKLEWCGYPMN